jgi:D-glycero-D-manno-heptose 1,7-bisphosphate phosphatase
MSSEVVASHAKFVARPPGVSAAAPGLHIPFNSRLLSNTGNLPARAAVFLDRDGVLVRDVHYLREPSQIQILPYVEQLCYLQDRYYLIVATNQSGIARNFFTEDALLLIHSKLIERLSGFGIAIDAFYYCPHLPNAVNPNYSLVCECRKPGAGLLRRASAEWGINLASSYLIGDSLRDAETGNAAGVAGSILVGDTNASEDPLKFRTAPDLRAAVNIILGGVA